MTASLKKINKRLDTEIAPAAFRFFRSITPVDTGNARRKTKLQGRTIRAKYNYASFLDKGHSGQAPDGMSNPTTEFLNKLVNRIMRK